MEKLNLTDEQIEEKARLMYNEYQREWYQNNKSKAKSNLRNYWRRKAEKELKKKGGK